MVDFINRFQTARANALALEQQENDLQDQKVLSPIKNELAGLKLQQAKSGIEQNNNNARRQEQLMRAKIINQSAKALKGINPQQRQAAFQRLAPRLEQFGIPLDEFQDAQFSDQELDAAIASTQGFLSNPQTLSAAEREFQSLTRGLSPEDELSARRRKLGLDARATGSAAQTITDRGNADDIAKTEEILAGGKESGKLNVQLKLKPKIQKAIKLAEAEAKERGEALTDLLRMEAALPGLTQTVSQLKDLAKVATSTLGGKAFDFVSKESGFGSTKGANARAKFIAIVNNQVLPLLKPTFGAAFTVQEGEALKATMGDPDASPEEKLAQLEAFIEQKIRDIQTKENQIGQTQKEGGQIMIDANGNRAVVFPDGTFEEL